MTYNIVYIVKCMVFDMQKKKAYYVTESEFKV